MTQHESEFHAESLVDQKRYDHAQKLLYELSERGSIYASLTLGWLYEAGAIGPRNAKAARFFYERAALAGDGGAHWRLGSLLARETELAPARAAFRAGAEIGHLGSMYRLGNMLREGEGGPQADEEGLFWLERAAKSGHLFAQARLLSIEAERSKSLAAKASRMRQRIAIMIRYAKEARKNIHSEKFEL